MKEKKFEIGDLVDLNWNIELKGLRSQKEILGKITRRIGSPPWEVKSFYILDPKKVSKYLNLYNRFTLKTSLGYDQDRFILIERKKDE